MNAIPRESSPHMNKSATGPDRTQTLHVHHDVDGLGEALSRDYAGEHHVPIGDGRHLKLRVSGAVSHHEGAVPVFFAAGRESSSGATRFWGSAIGRRVAHGFVEIADPSLEFADSLKMGWYAGMEGTRAGDIILTVLDTMARVWGRELVLIGGADGAFAALSYASRMRTAGSAFVWNPPTDLGSYNRQLVDAYLRLAHPTTFEAEVPPAQWQDRRRVQFRRAGIMENLNDPRLHRPGRIDRLLYLQNQSDWRTVAHCAPYVAAHGILHLGTGSYMIDPQHCVQVCDWGAGHAPLEPDALAESLRSFLANEETPLEIGRRLALDTCRSRENLVKAPRDLRHLRDSIAPLVHAEYATLSGSVEVSMGGDVKAGYGGLRFGVQQLAAGKSEQLAWYSDATSIPVEPRRVRHDGELKLIVRDGMNNTLAVLPVERKDPNLSELKAFIYGSCVTRDAFNLSGMPEVADYVARSPLLSAMGEKPDMGDVDGSPQQLSSAFQRRMVERDLNKSLPTLLEETPHHLMIVDLIDERLAVHVDDTGAYTRSNEAKEAGLHKDSGTEFTPLSHGFMPLWDDAVAKFAELVQPERVILNKIYWAETDNHGERLEPQYPVRAHNEALRAMYAAFEARIPCHVISYPVEILVADREHRWNLTPFHYVSGVYQHFRDELVRLVSDL